MLRSTESRINVQSLVLLLLVLSLMTFLFLLTPWSGDDWGIFHGAAKRILHRENLYATPITFGYYYNPPWAALAFTPLALVSEKFGWAVICAGTLMAILAVLRRWNPDTGIIKPVLALLSPPTMYIMLHGQIDALVLALVMLPSEWWALVAITKPQIAFGLLAGVPINKWQRVLLITGGVLLGSIVLFGLWPLDLLNSPRPFVTGAHNLWLNLWPFQIPVGIALITAGWSLGKEPNERLLLAASPFLGPYATTSSLIGPWLVTLSYLSTFQATLVWASWWGAVIYRGIS